MDLGLVQGEAIAHAMIQIVIAAGSSMYLGKAVAINVATTMYDSYQQSYGSLVDFSNIYTQKVNEIEMNGVFNYIIGAFTGDTLVKAAADVGQWLGGLSYDWTPDFIKEII
ncbi:thrombospondin, partial [Francisella tularensis subsp. holarctica]|nr:thrombospondin [Francisella tularensis subsp. holarctica]